MSRPKMWGEHIADGWYEVLDAETHELLQARKPQPGVEPIAGQHPEGSSMRAIYIEPFGDVHQHINRVDGADNPIPRAVILRVAAACTLLGR